MFEMGSFGYGMAAHLSIGQAFLFLLAGFLIPTPGCKDVVIHHNAGIVRIYFLAYAQRNILRSLMIAFLFGHLGKAGIRFFLDERRQSRIAPYSSKVLCE